MDASAVLRDLPHPVLVIAADGRIAYANEAAGALLPGPALPGRDPLDLFAPMHRTRAARVLLAARHQPGCTLRLRMAGRTERWLAVAGTPGPEGSIVLSVTDVTGQVLARRRLRHSEQRFRAAFEVAAHGAALVDGSGRILTVNGSLAELLGRTREGMVGLHVRELLEQTEQPRDDWARLGTVPRRLRHVRGTLVHTQVTAGRVDGEDGEPLFLVQVQDVTERRRSEQRLRHLALHDQLTELPSRHLLSERLHAALEQRTPAAPHVAALFVDLDGFKLVNDALGHAMGDEVLRETARRLRRATRPQDTVARLSGDEFVVVCPALTAEAEAVAVADRLAAALGQPIRTRDDEVPVSASIGVAFAGPGATPEQLLHEADTAMYRAKQLGRHRFEVYDTALRERATEGRRVQDLVRLALAEDRVVVHYQPVVELGSGRVVGVEALMRLRDRDGTLLAPGQFLDAAADEGVLPALDLVVLRTAAAHVVTWTRTYGRDFDLSVNLCAGQLDQGVAERVARALADAHLPAGRLVLDVTEAAIAALGSQAGERLRGLTRLGARVALDDFGRGSASLVQLSTLPVSSLKIDGSLVGLLPDDPHGLVRALCGVAGQLGLSAVGESVETEPQRAALAAMGAVRGQGRLFGPPVPAADVPGLIASAVLVAARTAPGS